MELLLVLVFGAAAAFVLAATTSLSGNRGVKRRLAKLADGSAAPIPIGDPSEARDRQHWIVKVLAPFAAQAGSGESASRVRRRLVEAGYRRDSAVGLYMSSRLVLALLLPILVLIASPAWNLAEMKLVLILCCAGGVGLVAPSYWLDKARSTRPMSIILGLPPALDLMVVCVEAGL